MDRHPAPGGGVPPPPAGHRRRGEMRLPPRSLRPSGPRAPGERHPPAHCRARAGFGGLRLGDPARHGRGAAGPRHLPVLPGGGRRQGRHRAGVSVTLPVRADPPREVPRDVLAMVGDDGQLPGAGGRRRRHHAPTRAPGRGGSLPGRLLPPQHRSASPLRRRRPPRGVTRRRHPALLLGPQRGEHGPEDALVGSRRHVLPAETAP
ncbi:hypothetical protein SDC9_93438 [bioreactor metagenome]|uniref:Uncharacterized protein n=1 Tax=bioreactor metagenome TaxID=1076179 RepID=A0A645A120_9ZZZZ